MRSALACFMLVVSLLQGAAQTSTNPGFDDLSHRAAAALDKNPAEAAALYRQALALRPDWAEGWFYMGASLYELNRYDESRDALRHAASLAPNNGAAWAFLGLSESELNDREHALADIQKGEALGIGDNRGFVSAVRSRAALLLIESSSFETAMEQLEPLARAGDNSPRVIEAFGLVTLGISRSPSDVPVEHHSLINLAGRAAWALAAQRPSDADTLYRELLTKYPSEPGVHYSYGIYELARDPEAALADFQKEIKINPAHVFARLQIAFLEMKRGNPDLAIPPAREAVRMQPANFLCHTALGRALFESGDVNRALPELETAAKLAPGNPQTHFYLERAYRRAGRKADAEKEKAEFIRLTKQRDPLSLPDNARPTATAQ